MKITPRERKLWLIVLIAIGGIIIYRIIFDGPESIPVTGEIRIFPTEGRRLISSGQNIIARHRAVERYLAELNSKFLEGSRPEQAGITLLERVEDLAQGSGLKVERKNVIDFSGGLIGVSLEGTTRPEAFFRMLHQVATVKEGFNIKRLQIHSNLESKDLKYQLIITIKIMKGAGKIL